MRKHFVQFDLLEIKASLKVGSFILTILLLYCRVLHSVQAYYYNLRNAYSVKNKRGIIKRFLHLWTQKVPLCTLNGKGYLAFSPSLRDLLAA
jgi:hypothetical protein